MFNRHAPLLSGTGARFPGAQLLATSARVQAYVHATNKDYPRDIATKLVTSIGDALARCRPGFGDIIVVLRGHSEVVDAALETAFEDNLKAGTQIIGECGLGDPSMPVLTADAGTVDVLVDNVAIRGIRFVIAANGDAGVGVNVVGANCLIEGCWFDYADASYSYDNAIEIAAGANDATVRGNVFRGVTTAPGTAVVEVAAAVDAPNIVGNVFIGPGVAAVGHVKITLAATNVYIADNDMSNTLAASTACISVADVAASGIFCRNMMATLNDGVAASQGIVFGGTTPTIKCLDNKSCDEPRKSGVLAPAAVAT